MARWRQLTKAGGLAAGAMAASAGAVLVAEKIAVGRLRLRPDPAAGQQFGRLRGQPVTVPAADGVPLHAEVSGRTDAPVTVVFSHGYTLSQDTWHYQRQALADTARLVLWDQRGHGQSGHGDPARSTIGQLGSDLAAVLAATVPADGKVVLAGHSMGGMTIMALARLAPELFGAQVAGTVLVSTAASEVDPAYWLPAPLRPIGRRTTPPVLRGASRGAAAALIERGRRAGGDLAFLSTRYIAFGDPGVSPATVDFLERVIRATPIEVIEEFYRALVAHDEEAALDIIGKAPCVVLTGECDRLIATRRTAGLASQIPGAELVSVPGAGHLLILEQPDVVSEAIRTLAERVSEIM